MATLPRNASSRGVSMLGGSFGGGGVLSLKSKTERFLSLYTSVHFSFLDGSLFPAVAMVTDLRIYIYIVILVL